MVLDKPELREQKGFLAIDHLTNNVPAGEMERWAEFYKTIFGFTSVRYFDIRGAKTGLTSYALRSPDGSFCIPVNQPKSDSDQIAIRMHGWPASIATSAGKSNVAGHSRPTGWRTVVGRALLSRNCDERFDVGAGAIPGATSSTDRAYS